MKGLGLAGAGLGAAALTAPVFHDVDELTSSAGSLEKHPWYVKERELLDPTIDVDWNIMKRYDRAWQGQMGHVQSVYYGTDRVNKASANSGALSAQLLKGNTPGFGHKWEVLRNALGQSNTWSAGFTGPEGASLGATPDTMGVPKWQGSPEENSKLLMAATRLFGVGEIGFAQLDDTLRNKLVVSYTTDGVSASKYNDLTVPYPPPDTERFKYVYEDVSKAYYTKNKGVIPTAERWVIFLSGPEPRETDRTAVSRMSKSNLVSNSGIRNMAYFSTHKFLNGLGYSGIGLTGHQSDMFNTGTIAVLTGKAECGRHSNWPISIAYGPRAFDMTQTIDLPVAPSKPIDAGIWRFCQTCGICADVCPSNSIPKKGTEPSFDKPNIEGKPDTQHSTGAKLIWFNGASCRLWVTETYPGTGCSLCAANCTFSTGSAAVVHSVLKGTIANVGVFNGFLANMGRTFGYGNYKDPEEWWDQSLPMLGIDTTTTALHGGYRK